jgi:cytochrome c-type biogenesis protein CcmH
MGVLPTILFWPAAATLAVACALLVLSFGARAARRAAAAAEDPTRAVYRRQLHDLDEMVDRGVLDAGEREAARAEAARRLLAEPQATAERSGSRRWPLVIAGLAAVVALCLYLKIGAPGTPDQPYRARLAQWQAQPLNSLRPDEVAAQLRELVKHKPNDPRLLALLGRVEQMAGDPVSSVQYLNRAIKLDPNNANLYAALGQALAAASGDKPTPEAEAALNRALTIDPTNQAALYYLGGARAADGDRAGASELWRKLAGELPPADPRRVKLLAAVDQIQSGAASEPETANGTPGMSADQAGFIRGMVASLQAKLDTNPDDPAGWARLVRSYKVLGDKTAEAKALARARALFAKRPADLGPIEAEAK